MKKIVAPVIDYAFNGFMRSLRRCFDELMSQNKLDEADALRNFMVNEFSKGKYCKDMEQFNLYACQSIINARYRNLTKEV